MLKELIEKRRILQQEIDHLNSILDSAGSKITKIICDIQKWPSGNYTFHSLNIINTNQIELALCWNYDTNDLNFLYFPIEALDAMENLDIEQLTQFMQDEEKKKLELHKDKVQKQLEEQKQFELATLAKLLQKYPQSKELE
jgi:hypothetical protein